MISSQKSTSAITPISSRPIQTPSGLILALHDWGGSGPACLCLHGTAESSFVWNDLATAAIGVQRIVAIDLPGHGESHWQNKPYSLSSFMTEILDAAALLAMDKFALVGHSLGGALAAKLAASCSNVSALILVDCGPAIDSSARKLLKERLLEGYRPYKSYAEYTEWLRGMRPLTPEQSIKNIAANSLRLHGDGTLRPVYDPRVLDILTAQPDDSWWSKILPAIQCPTLILRGVGSAVLSRSAADKMTRLLSSGRQIVVPNAGHAVMLDNPEYFTFSALEFLKYTQSITPNNPRNLTT